MNTRNFATFILVGAIFAFPSLASAQSFPKQATTIASTTVIAANSLYILQPENFNGDYTVVGLQIYCSGSSVEFAISSDTSAGGYPADSTHMPCQPNSWLYMPLNFKLDNNGAGDIFFFNNHLVSSRSVSWIATVVPYDRATDTTQTEFLTGVNIENATTTMTLDIATTTPATFETYFYATLLWILIFAGVVWLIRKFTV